MTDTPQPAARPDAPDGDPQANRTLAPLLLAAAVVVVIIVAAVIWSANTTSGTKTRPTPSPTSSASATAGAAAPRTPDPTSSPSGAAGHDVVAAAPPQRFTISGGAFTISATVCGMPFVRPLDPPGEQHHTVCWVKQDFGYAPASSGRGTTYVLGHSWGQDSKEVLNKLSEAAMRQVLPQQAHHRSTALDGVATYPVTALDGYVVTLRTSTGVLRYTVRRSYAVKKSDAGTISSLMDQNTPDRVVIITCGELDHVDYDDNIVVEAYLTSSTATPATT